MSDEKWDRDLITVLGFTHRVQAHGADRQTLMDALESLLGLAESIPNLPDAKKGELLRALLSSVEGVARRSLDQGS